eukprot:2293861-Rhodomonas_salina.1
MLVVPTFVLPWVLSLPENKGIEVMPANKGTMYQKTRVLTLYQRTRVLRLYQKNTRLRSTDLHPHKRRSVEPKQGPTVPKAGPYLKVSNVPLALTAKEVRRDLLHPEIKYKKPQSQCFLY